MSSQLLTQDSFAEPPKDTFSNDSAHAPPKHITQLNIGLQEKETSFDEPPGTLAAIVFLYRKGCNYVHLLRTLSAEQR